MNEDRRVKLHLWKSAVLNLVDEALEVCCQGSHRVVQKTDKDDRIRAVEAGHAVLGMTQQGRRVAPYPTGREARILQAP